MSPGVGAAPAGLPQFEFSNSMTLTDILPERRALRARLLFCIPLNGTDDFDEACRRAQEQANNAYP